MLLKSIKYHNFRPFIGDQKIILSSPNDDLEKNVTIILGDNTFGKSTFVLSFIWCLYGESRFTKANDILNKKIEKELPPDPSVKEKTVVEIEFEDEGIEYTMRREQAFWRNENGQIKADDSKPRLTYIDPETHEAKSVGITVSEINTNIKQILPKDLSNFFFFEGEKNNEIKRKDLGQAVRTLLGLEAFNKMMEHLHGSSSDKEPTATSVMGEYLKKQDDGSNKKAKEEFERKERAENDLNDVKEKIKEKETEIQNYEGLIDKVNERLREAKPSKEMQKRRDFIARDLIEAEDSLEQKSNQYFRTFSGGSFSMFVYPLLDPASKKLEKMQVNDKGIKGIEASAINELLKRGVCLCGCDLKEGTAPYKNVAKYIDYVPPRSIGTLVRDMDEMLVEEEDKAKNFVNTNEEQYKEIVKLREKINNLEKEDEAILQNLKEIGLIDTEGDESDLSKYKTKLQDLRIENNQLNSRKGSLESEIQTATKNYNTLIGKNESARKYKVYYKYAEAIYNWVNKHYSQKEDELRERLGKNISELFNNMYSGHREISIDKQYNMRMTYQGEVVDDTGGLRVIEYFAYVGGLVKLAHEVKVEREKEDDEGTDSETLGEEYPLVLDAAFSHADDTHTKNIAKELSKCANQLIFAMMKKDWTFAKEGLEGRVGRMYELEKIDETEVHIKEVQ